jgi:hypothetical protein
VTETVAAAGAGVAWIGVTLLTVSEARRGLAVGLALAALGLALAAAAAGQAPPAVATLVAGGLVAAAMRLRGGPHGWGVLPPGSTPRLAAAIVVLLAAAVVDGSAIASPEGAARLAALVVSVLAVGTVLTARQPWSALGAGSALALGLGALGGPGGLVAGAAVAAGLGVIEGPEPARTEG